MTQPKNNKKYIHSKIYFGVATSILFSIGTQCFAAGDSGDAVTLSDLTKKGATIATEFTGDKNQHGQLANFAWREFIALNSPAGSLPENRGIPNTNKSFVDSGRPNFYSSGKKTGKIGTNLLVWETFAHRSELFPHYTIPPTTPAKFAKTPSYIFKDAPTFSNDVLALYNNLDEASQIGQNIIFFPKNPPNASKNPFDDHQLLFEAKVNKTEFDYGQTLTKLSKPVNLKDNSVEVKAAWRLMSPDLDSSRYHTADAVYYVPGKKASDAPIAKNGTFGLVGLHIIQKTKLYPTFIFATFEQVDALKLPKGGPTGLYYITDYTALGYDPQGIPSIGAKNTTAPIATINNGSGKLVKHTLPAASAKLQPTTGLPNGHTGPVKVTQPATITKQVESVNRNVLSLMTGQKSPLKNSVWQYYKLKGVQAIPTNEQDPMAAASTDTLDYYLANITIESSQPGVQLFKGGIVGPGDKELASTTDFINNRETDSYVPYQGHAAVNATNVTFSAPSTNPDQPLEIQKKVIMGGCMGCHGQAQQSGVDFSFLFFSRGGSGFDVDTMGEIPPAAMAKRAAKYHVK